MESLFTINSMLALLTLTGMEIVLGIDNIIFLAILANKVPPAKRERIRKQGIGLALFSRLALLFSITWIMSLQKPLFSAVGRGVSGRDLILIGGGLFLVGKATVEIHDKLESGGEEAKIASISGSTASPPLSKNGSGKPVPRDPRYKGLLAQIVILDIVFSLDSVITAVGMANHLSVMVIAMVLAVGVMLVASRNIGIFVEKHPTIKILALAFLLLIGVTLVADGMGAHINKGYIYFAMFFSFTVEILNIHYMKKHNPVEMHFPREP